MRAATAPGSSPLARGLRSRRMRKRRSNRIIPARAGFTFVPADGNRRPADHPRSRGVYREQPGRRRRHDGSSPLARGLPERREVSARGVRIIPARAGFTQGTGLLGGQGGDHPRSRGVYPACTPAPCANPGSSPLARGLRKAAAAEEKRARIIPARAGFTSPHPTPPPRTPDHPRSRGVYYAGYTDWGDGRGSSPLARGLRPWSRAPPGTVGIIPARAGFTALECPAQKSPSGSSPLARGLPRAVLGSRRGRRIIPARAGFTTSPDGRTGGSKDHPRSRGVYTCGSLESQRTRTLPDPCCLHCRPRARSAELR